LIKTFVRCYFGTVYITIQTIKALKNKIMKNTYKHTIKITKPMARGRSAIYNIRYKY